jgi:hypothetical protein
MPTLHQKHALSARWVALTRTLLDIGRFVERPDRLQGESVFLAPVKELVTGPCVSQPGVAVPDGGREENGEPEFLPWRDRLGTLPAE